MWLVKVIVIISETLDYVGLSTSVLYICVDIFLQQIYIYNKKDKFLKSMAHVSNSKRQCNVLQPDAWVIILVL